MKKLALFAAGLMVLTLGACSSLGGYFDNPANDLQIARATFSTALSLYESVCNTNAGASFCTAADIQEAIDLETAVNAALSVAESALSVTAGASVSSAMVQADVQNVVTAVQKFSDFVNSLQVQKAKAAHARMISH